MILVPATSTVLVAFSWKESYLFLAGVLLIVVLPIAAWLIKNSPQDLGMLPFGQLDQGGLSDSTTSVVFHESAKTDTTFKGALGN